MTRSSRTFQFACGSRVTNSPSSSLRSPEISGFTSFDALKIMLGVCAGQNLVGMDLVEVLPDTDHGDITSFAAAGIMHAFISSLAANKAQSRIAP